MPRLYCEQPLAPGARLALPPGAARHVQVLRLQPGGAVTLFDGRGGEYEAAVTHMGRSDVEVEVGAHHAIEREADVAVHLAIGMPANERMDWLVEKATELGVASIQPLLAERSVLRLAGDRAQKKQAHWQGIAVAACEQCGRNRVPLIHAVQPLAGWIAAQPAPGFVLSLREGAVGLAQGGGLPESRPMPSPQASRRVPAALDHVRSPAAALGRAGPREVTFLSGPEGGLAGAEEDAAIARGWTPVHLGSRVLRAETAPLAALAVITLGGRSP